MKINYKTEGNYIENKWSRHFDIHYNTVMGESLHRQLK